MLGLPLLVVRGRVQWYTMRGIYGLLNLSYPCMSEVTLSPMEVEIWWMGLVWFLLGVVDLGLSFRLLSCSIEVDIFPIEVGRGLEEAIRLVQLFKLQVYFVYFFSHGCLY